MSDIDVLKKEVLTHFDNQKIFKFAKAFGRFSKAANLSLEELTEFYVELSRRNPEIFMEKFFPGSMMPQNSQTLNDNDKMHLYVLHKYGTLEGEEILTQFFGSVYEKKTASSGLIVLTNFRLISFGRQVTRSAQKQVSVKPRLGSMLVRSAITRHRKNIQKAIMRSFRKDLKEWNVVEWGYNYPIYNIKKFKRGNKSISYTTEVETEKKTKSIAITITPLRPKKQPKGEFAEQQQAMARLTGNYKRGNERTAKNHPRNRR